jgi:chromate transport protein ChrA
MAMLLGAIGLMLAVPRAAGARGFLIASLACNVIAIAAGLFTEGMMSTSAVQTVLAMVSGLLSVVGVVLFVMFLKQLGTFLGFGDPADKADKVIALFLAVAIGQFASFCGVLMLLVAGLAIVAVGLYVSLLLDLYRAANYRRKHGVA